MAGRTTTILGAGLALSAAAAIGGWAGWEARSPVPVVREAPGGGGPSEAQIAALEDRLDVEASSRMELATRLAAIEERLAGLERDGVAIAAAPQDAEPDLTEAHSVAPGPPGTGGPGWMGGRVDVETLVAAGFPRGKAEDARRLLDQIDLERLYLRDRATREGWVDEPRFTEESRALGNGLGDIRSEYGDELYDWVLFASGRPNRVVVDDVMAGSAAAEAGLQAGDVVRSYDGDSLFRPRELRDATQAGRAGESIAIEVERDGSVERLFIPRGPLGVRIRPDRQEPAPAG
ncbi:MAG: PDZ domain-containing protein [Myxococcota bacterium]|nr:PDZ domain-containing protein [Myxococcota bacterium]